MLLKKKKKSHLSVLREDFINEAKKAHKHAQKRMSHIVEQASNHPKVVNIKHSVKERPVSSGITALGIGMAVLGLASFLIKK